MAVIMSPEQAAAEVTDGSCLGIGGSINTGHPMALVRALIRAKRSDITLVGLTSGIDLDLLVGSGCVSRLSSAYVGAEDILGLPPSVRWAAEEGRLEIWESEEGIHLSSLRARALKQPYATWTGTLGTSPASHPLVEEAIDPVTGAHYLKVRPLAVDTAFVWAEAADEDGNLLLWGPDLGDEALRNAADLRIAQVEKVVPTSVLEAHPDRVVPWAAEAIVPAPLSTHPFGSTQLRVDAQWIRDYGAAVAAARSDELKKLDDFFDYWFHSVNDEDGYFERLGVSRIRGLMG